MSTQDYSHPHSSVFTEPVYIKRNFFIINFIIDKLGPGLPTGGWNW